MTRKIVQIAACDASDSVSQLYALASDGTLWVGMRSYGGSWYWTKLPALPEKPQ